MLSTKKKHVTLANQMKLNRRMVPVLKPKIGSTLPTKMARVTFMTCVRGKTAMANPCATTGREVSGKKVPHKKNMGVKKRKVG